MMPEAPFFDPYLAELQRQLAHQQTTGVADLRLRGQRLTEDVNLLRPYMKRRFGRQAEQVSSGVAERGFHGGSSGILSRALGLLGEEQAFQSGQFERQHSRQQEDIERAIANLTSQNILQGAEGTRRGAGNAAVRINPF